MVDMFRQILIRIIDQMLRPRFVTFEEVLTFLQKVTSHRLPAF